MLDAALAAKNTKKDIEALTLSLNGAIDSVDKQYNSFKVDHWNGWKKLVYN